MKYPSIIFVVLFFSVIMQFFNKVNTTNRKTANQEGVHKAQLNCIPISGMGLTTKQNVKSVIRDISQTNRVLILLIIYLL